METLGVVTARMGSKRLPGKNKRPLLGRPLVDYTFEAARASRRLRRVIVSTDDPDVITLAQAAGVEAPFVRPAHLAEDKTPSLDVLLHALAFLREQEGYVPDALVILEPTAPLRTAEDVDAVLELHERMGTDSAVSVVASDHWHPIRAKRLEAGILADYCLPEKEGVRRQDLPPAYFRNGAVYSVREAVLRGQRSLYGRSTAAHVMPPERSVDVNDEVDLLFAEALLRRAREREARQP